MLNDWNDREVKRAETTWGGKIHPYTKDLFNFAVAKGDSWLDLGCGFGRFLEFLDKKFEEIDYIGYDSSESMIERISARFPQYMLQTFCRDITEPISHPKQVIISSAVFIHITVADQIRILKNLVDVHPKPKAIAFDINCPNERTIENMYQQSREFYERRIRTTKDGTSTFRMTWQSHRVMTSRLVKMFPMYQVSLKFYDLRSNQHKVMYFLELK